jgi:LysM repeat protein
MTPIRFIAPSLAAVALVSCAPDKADRYDTANPYGTPDAGTSAAQAPAAPSNPIYDTPAAYEESSAAVTPAAPGVPAATPPVTNATAVPPVAAPVPTAPPDNGSAVIHTVVAGDTLSGLSSKYKVPIASIKAANRMTNDTVVLGRKMVIPPR